MNEELAARIYNEAIEDAARKYPRGIAAIRALKKRFVVIVEHVGTTTKQEVVEIDQS